MKGWLTITMLYGDSMYLYCEKYTSVHCQEVASKTKNDNTEQRQWRCASQTGADCVVNKCRLRCEEVLITVQSAPLYMTTENSLSSYPHYMVEKETVMYVCYTTKREGKCLGFSILFITFAGNKPYRQ